MNDTLIIEILLGGGAFLIAFATYLAGSRANKAASMATITAVDADAYKRAKEIYEGALASLRIDMTSMRDETVRLRESNDSLRTEIYGLRTEISLLRTDNARRERNGK